MDNRAIYSHALWWWAWAILILTNVNINSLLQIQRRTLLTNSLESGRSEKMQNTVERAILFHACRCDIWILIDTNHLSLHRCLFRKKHQNFIQQSHWKWLQHPMRQADLRDISQSEFYLPGSQRAHSFRTKGFQSPKKKSVCIVANFQIKFFDLFLSRFPHI